MQLLAVVAAILLGVSYGHPVVRQAAEKRTAEMLVGIWDDVKLNGRPPEFGQYVTMEFTRDGKAIIRYKARNDPPGVQRATYKVVGNAIQMVMLSGTTGKTRTLVIKRLTADTLITAHPVESYGVTESVRRRAK